MTPTAARCRAFPFPSPRIFFLALFLVPAVFFPAAVRAAGAISGTVTAAAGGPAAGVRVVAHAAGNPWTPAAETTSAGNGAYTLSGLPAGDYRVLFDGRPAGHFDSWYPDKPFFQVAENVTVAAGATTSGINGALDPCARISGTVTSAGGGALAGVTVELAADDGWGWWDVVAAAVTDPSGNYLFSGLLPGTWRLRFDERPAAHFPRFHPAGADWDEAGDLVLAAAGSHLSGVNAVLDPSGAISGTVTAAAGGAPLAGVQVSVFLIAGNLWQLDVYTGADGRYLAGGLASGDYRLQVRGGPAGHGDLTVDPVAVTSPGTAGDVDASLPRVSALSGTVTAVAGPGIPGVTVEIYPDGQGWPSYQATTGADGAWLAAVPAGDYQVRFRDWSDFFAPRWYPDAGERAGAATIVVAADGHVTGIDGTLAPATGGLLWGRLASAVDGRGVPGFELILADATVPFDQWGPDNTWSDADQRGWYLFPPRTAGEYKMRAEKESWGDPSPYAPQWYDRQADFDAADLIVMPASGAERVDLAMEPGGTVSGRVVDADTGDPLAGVLIDILYPDYPEWSWYQPAGWSETDADGRFSVGGLATGEYKVRFDGWSAGYRTAYYDEKFDFNSADRVAVVVAEDTPLGEVLLSPMASIAGTVRDEFGAPLAGAQAQAERVGGGGGQSPTTGADGAYRITGLEAGEYRVRFSASGYYDRWYLDAPSQGAATPLVLAEGEQLAHIDGALPASARLEGTVTDEDGAPLAGVSVIVHEAFNPNWSVAAVSTGADGTYSVPVRPTSPNQQYRVQFYKADRLTFWYDQQVDWNSADRVPDPGFDAYSQEVVAGIDAVLPAAGAIRGRVLARDGGAPVSGAIVRLSAAGAQHPVLASEWTGADGRFAFTRVDSGDYRLEFSHADYLAQWYAGAESHAAAADVSVTRPDETLLDDVHLVRAAGVSGTVRRFSDNALLNNVSVQLWRPGASGFAYSDWTNASGSYAITGVDPDHDYQVRFFLAGYSEQWYDGQAARATADLLELDEGESRAGVDALLYERGNITGTVTDAYTGQPVANVTVARHQGGFFQASASTNHQGVYVFPNLDVGDYNLRFWHDNYIVQWYDGKPDEGSADPVAVAGLGVVTANAALVTRGAIAGVVTGSDTGGAGVPGISVYLYTQAGAHTRSATTGADGAYIFNGLDEGAYRLRFLSGTSAYLGRWHAAGDSHATADDAAVAYGQVTTVDITLPRGGTVTGTVTDSASEDPISGVLVTLYTGAGDFVKNTLTGADGVYTLIALAGGDYRLHFSHAHYIEQYSDAFTVVPPETVTRDAVLVMGGKLAGRVTDWYSGDPLAGVSVAVHDATGALFKTGGTGADGTWEVPGAPAGDYRVRFTRNEYFEQWYAGKPDLAAADPVAVIPPHTAGDIDAVLVRGGWLAGTVTRSDTGAPLINVIVTLFTATGESIGTRMTAPDGYYRFSGLEAGGYLVHFDRGGFSAQWYDDKPDQAGADPVPVALSEGAEGIDAALLPHGAIAGTVTGVGDAPLEGIRVVVHDAQGQEVNANFTDADGAYQVGNLPPGTYRVYFDPRQTGYLGAWYDNRADFASADPVAVIAPDTTGDIDATLSLGGGISGVVSGLAAGAAPLPLETARVRLYAAADPGGAHLRQAFTGADGAYAFIGLPEGEYLVQASRAGYLARWHDGNGGVPGAVGALALAVAPPGGFADVDITLPEPGGISGRLTDSVSADGVAGVTARAYNENGSAVASAVSGADGAWQIGGLEQGGYRLRFEAEAAGYFTAWHNGADLETAEVIAVAPPEVTPGADAALVRGGAIAGTVTGDGGAGVQSAQVYVYQAAGGPQVGPVIYTDADGNYLVRPLPAGDYEVYFRAVNVGYLNQWYDAAHDRAGAAAVGVELGETTPGIDAALVRPASIAGTVTDDATGEPVNDFFIYLRDGQNDYITSTRPAADGTYLFDNLRAGVYRVHFDAPAQGYLGQWYDGADSAEGVADIVLGVGESRVAIDAALVRPGGISGTVRDDSGAPLAGVTVRVRRQPEGALVGSAVSDADGAWAFSNTAMNAGDYYVHFVGTLAGYLDQWHPLAEAAGDAEPVAVTPPETTGGIDAALRRPRVTARVEGAGGIVEPAEQEVAYNAAAEVFITPGVGWSIDELTDNGTLRSVNALTYTASNVRGDREIVVTFREVPDLVVTSVTMPAEAFTGGAVDVTWVLHNQGRLPAAGPWTDRVHLSPDGGETLQTLANFTFQGTLEPGASVTRVQPVTIPASIIEEADYHFAVTADVINNVFEGRVFEPGRNNNRTVSAAPVLVRVSPRPDLVVSSVTGPANAFSGQTVEVAWTVENIGNGPTDAPTWHDRVYLSLSETWDQTAVPIGYLRNASYLPPGESYQSGGTFNLPQGLEGEYYFIVHTDFHNSVFEWDTDNNAGHTAVTLAIPDLPDLVVTAVTVPAFAASGQPVDISWTVQNTGAAPTVTSVWRDAVFLSENDDPEIAADDIHLGNFRHAGALAPGAAYTFYRPVTLPPGVSGENMFIKVWTDRWNAVFEHVGAQNNVTASGPFQIVLQTPDLEVTAVTAPASALAGWPLEVSWTVANPTAWATPNTWWDDAVWLSESVDLDTAVAVRLGTLRRSGRLDGGSHYEAQSAVRLPEGISGDYHVFVVADSGNLVYEFDTDNNVARAPGPLSVEFRPADLAVTAFEAPAAADTGAAVTVAWTVENLGPGATAVDAWRDRIYITADPALESGLKIMGNFDRAGPLDPGEGYTRAEVVQVPFDIQGPHFIFVVADLNEAVYEPAATRSNNRSSGAPVEVRRVGADLAATAVSGPAAADSGGPVIVEWTVANLGEGRTNRDNWRDRVILAAEPGNPADDIALGTVYRSGALEPGESYTVSREFTLGPDVAGPWRLLVVADIFQEVADPDRDNNRLPAAHPTEVTLTPAPDLVLAEIVVPPTAFSGRPLEITWTVRNDDAATGPDAAWQDAFWLSRDQVLDNTDTFIGWVGHSGGLGAGESYTRTASFDLPLGLAGPFYIFGRTDRWNRVHERGRDGNNVAYRLEPLLLELPEPADLAVTAVTVPGSAAPGERFDFAYTVENIGAHEARGSWQDALYLSPVPGWSPEAVSLERVVAGASPLAPGADYSRLRQLAMPGLLPGAYHGLVRADIFNTVLESNLENNLGVSGGTVLVDAPAIELDTPVSFELERGGAAWYRLEVDTAGQTLLFTLDGGLPNASNELFVSFGRMPSRGDHDFAFGRLHSPDQEIIVPLTRDGTYYVMAYAATAANECILEATIIPFSLRRFDPEAVGDAGPVTLRFRGARFTRETAFSLLPPGGGTPLAPTRIYFRDSGTAYATFDLAGAAPGEYAVRASGPGGEEAEAPEPLLVVPGVGPRLDARVGGHSALLAGRNYVFYINYGNIGDGDGAPPLMIVRTLTGTPFGFNLEELDTRPRQILAGSPGGVAGIIRPGERYNFPMFFRSGSWVEGVHFTVDIITVDDPTPIDWNLLEASLRPEGLSDTEWALVWARIRARVGDTWGDYVRVLGEIATLLGARGDEAWDVAELFAELYAQEAGYPTARIGGHLLDAETGQVLAGVPMTAFSGEIEGVEIELTWLSEAETGADGAFLFTGLPAGAYALAVPGWFLPDPPEIVVGPGADALGLVVYAKPEPPEPEMTPADWNDREIVFALDAAGVPHLAWLRGNDAWHAWYDGAGWVDAAPVTDTAGGDPGPVGNLSFAAGAGLIDGTAEGLALVWQAGEGNETALYRAVGAPREPGPGYRWSAPAALTGAPQADEHPAAAVLGDGRLLVVFQRVDLEAGDPEEGVRDDSDLYFAVYDIVSGEIDWRDPAASGRLPADMSPQDIGTSFDWKVRAGTGKLPRWIPILGGRDAKFETHLWGNLSGGAEFSGSVGGTKKVTLFGYIDGEFSGSGNIKYVNNCAHTDYPNCCYVFGAATLHLGGNVSAFIPVGTWVVPGDGWFVGKLLEVKIGPKISAGISGMMGWSGGGFPGLPNTGEVSLNAGLGGQGEASVLDEAAKGTVSLMGNVGYELLPGRKPTGTILTLALDIESGNFKQGWSKTWSWTPREGFFGWSDEPGVPGLTPLPPPARLPASFLPLEDGSTVEYIEDDSGLITVTTSPITFGWRPTVGLGENYAQPAEGIMAVLGDDVEDRIHEDGPPALSGYAAGPGGELLLAWARHVDPGAFGQDGSEVAVAAFDTDAGAWGAPAALPGSIGYNDAVSVTFAGETPLVVWSRIDSTGLGAETTAGELLARLETGAIAWSARSAGAWSETALLFNGGRNFRPALGPAAAEGYATAAWLNRETPESEDLRLMAAFWDPASGQWSVPAVLASGALSETPRIVRASGRTVVFWVADIGDGPDDEPRRRIFSRAYDHDAGAWGAPAAFEPALRAGLSAADFLPGRWLAESVCEPFFSLPQPPLCCSGGPCHRHKTDPRPRPDPPDPPEPPEPGPGRRNYNPPVLRPFDPNDMLGPEGYGPERWIRAADPIFYTIRFENDPDWATAPAQEVIITQQLDDGLDPRAFRVGSFGWGERRFEVPDNRSFHYQRVDLREEEGYFVDFFAFVDVTTGQARWQITTIDPATGQKPLDPFAGFLPPNDDDGAGEGFVTYTITPRRDVPTGTVIDAEARIVFDTEAPIDTPPIFNTLDALPPESTVLPLPELVSGTTVFEVAWTGTDDPGGSGLAHYTIYVSAAGGPWEPWLAETTLTAAPFTGAPGVAYRFYSVAVDNTGNSEEVFKQLMAGIEPEAETFVRDPDAVHTITATAGPGGVIDPAGAVAVPDGTDRRFTIEADPFHYIAGVLVDGEPVGAVAEYTFSDVFRDHAIHAEFYGAPAAPDPAGIELRYLPGDGPVALDAVGVDTAIAVIGPAFVPGQEGDAHAAGEFELRLAASGDLAWADASRPGDLRRAAFGRNLLKPGEVYALRLRYRDDRGHWSPWSEAVLTTVPAAETLDAAGSGVPDAHEPEAAEIAAAGLEAYAGLPGTGITRLPGGGLLLAEASGGETVGYLAPLDPPEDPPFGSLPHELLLVRLENLPGPAAGLRLLFPEALPPGTEWYAYDETAPEGERWSVLEGVAPDGAEVLLAPADGGSFDLDRVENGTLLLVAAPLLPGTRGDIDDDGEITMADVVLALGMAAGRTVEVGGEHHAPDYPGWLTWRADIDGDGRVTVADALAILRLAFGF